MQVEKRGLNLRILETILTGGSCLTSAFVCRLLFRSPTRKTSKDEKRQTKPDYRLDVDMQYTGNLSSAPPWLVYVVSG